MAGTGDVDGIRSIVDDFQGIRISDQRLAGVTIDGDNVGAFRRMANEAGAVLVRSVLMEWTGQHKNKQRSEADEGCQFG